MSPHPLKIGVAFELSRISSIEPQPHDIAMDFIVTEIGVYFVKPAGLELIQSFANVVEIATAIAAERNYIACDAEQPARGQAWHDRRGEPQYSSPPCYAHEFEIGDKDE